MIEILEAIVLAVVAVVTAWSGFRSAKWDGVSAREYATSSRLRSEGGKQQLTANQYQLYNTNVQREAGRSPCCWSTTREPGPAALGRQGRPYVRLI